MNVEFLSFDKRLRGILKVQNDHSETSKLDHLSTT